MSFIFISSIVNDKYAININYSIAGNNYQKKVVKAIDPKITYSLNYWNKREIVSNENNINFYIFPIKKLFRIYYLLQFTYQVISNTNKKTDSLLFYNLDTRNLIIYVICKYLKRYKAYVILADCNLASKSMFNKLTCFLLRKANGLLSLSRQININKNTVYQEILIDANEIVNADNKSDLNAYNILISGSLGETTGLKIAINAMHYLESYHLHICGPLFDIDSFTLNNWLRNAPKNITYYGLLEEIEYKNLLTKCEICLSLRKPSDKEHLFNFPSKIGEYLYFNRQVISTIPYLGFNDYLHYCDWNAESLSQTIRTIEKKIFNTENFLLDFGLNSFNKKLESLTEFNSKNKLP